MATRQRKILRDNIQGLTNPAFQRIARQAGVKSMSSVSYLELRGVTKVHMEQVIYSAMMYMEHDRRKTLGLNDILRGIEDQGDKLAFSNAMKKAVHACKM